MQDRLALYPGRFLMIPVAGQEGLVDLVRADEPTVEGDPLNSATFLTPATLALLGVPEPQRAAFTPNNALALLGRTMPVWDLLTEYKTAGTFSWTAPDLYGDGRPYKVGVYGIGGGASGSIGTASQVPYGGASGFSFSIVLSVTPGQTYTGVIGAGGARVSAGTSVTINEGNNGGATSFAGKTAAGGFGTPPSIRMGCAGGQGSDRGMSNAQNITDISQILTAPMGGRSALLLYNSSNYVISGMSTPNMTTNPFDLQIYLAAGGSVLSSVATSIQSGAVLFNGLKSGDAVTTTSTIANATSPGCGGGACIYPGSGTHYSGSGAPGAIYIYLPKKVVQ